MSAPINVGLAGCGRIARMFHVPVLRDLPGARLVALADPDTSAREAALATAPGATGVANVEELLAVPGLDAVVIALPTHLHAVAAVACFEAGKHVYLEKPLATDLEEGRSIHRAWRASGRQCAVGFNFRFHPLYEAARRTLAEEQLGEVVAVRAVFSSAPRAAPEWKRSRHTGGGALLDLASHQIDLVRYLLGAEVQAVSASIRSQVSPQDTVALTLHLSTGVVAQLLATASAAASDRLDVLGSAASLDVDRMARRRFTLVPAATAGGLGAARRVLAEGARSTLDRLRPPPEPSFAAALAAFVESIRPSTAAAHSTSATTTTATFPAAATPATVPSTPSPTASFPTAGTFPAAATIHDGLCSLAVVDAAERSADSGAGVVVPDPVGNLA